jgi:hypothetical protein
LRNPEQFRNLKIAAQLTNTMTTSILDGTQSITLWHHQSESFTHIPTALIRRYRHRLYSQVVDSPVPVNFCHWYFSTSAVLLPGDEILETSGTVWTVLEVNQSLLTGVWQAVCETFAFAEPTEKVDHIRLVGGQYVPIALSLPVRVGTKTTTLEPNVSERLPFYVRPSAGVEAIVVEPNDVFRQSDGSQWKIVRVERPAYRARWTVVVGMR